MLAALKALRHGYGIQIYTMYVQLPYNEALHSCLILSQT